MFEVIRWITIGIMWAAIGFNLAASVKLTRARRRFENCVREMGAAIDTRFMDDDGYTVRVIENKTGECVKCCTSVRAIVGAMATAHDVEGIIYANCNGGILYGTVETTQKMLQKIITDFPEISDMACEGLSVLKSDEEKENDCGLQDKD